MIFLFAAIAVSMTLVFTLKVAHIKGWDADNITLVNYGFASAVSFTLCVGQGRLPAFSAVGQLEPSAVFSEQSVSGTIFLALMLGAGTGMLYVVNITLTNVNVKNNGAGISTLFSRSGFLISVALSCVIFSEKMTPQHWTGAALTIIALALAGGVGGKTRLVKPLCLVGSLMCIGFSDANNKLFQSFALDGYKANYTTVVFFFAGVLFLAIFLLKKRGKKIRFRWQEVAAGAVMGIPNAFGSIFQMLALSTIPASVMFPSMAAGSLLASTLLSTLVFKETFDTRKILAVVFTTVGLVLVNI